MATNNRAGSWLSNRAKCVSHLGGVLVTVQRDLWQGSLRPRRRASLARGTTAVVPVYDVVEIRELRSETRWRPERRNAGDHFERVGGVPRDVAPQSRAAPPAVFPAPCTRWCRRREPARVAGDRFAAWVAPSCQVRCASPKWSAFAWPSAVIMT